MSRSQYAQTVRVFCTYQDPDHETPWQNHAPRSSTGSGVVVAPGRILTGAHVVANGTFIQVQKVSSPDKVVARVSAISHDSDLALLEVDRSFTRGMTPAEIGGLPRLGDEVAVVGFPVGGEELSITEGVVSRIEVQRYEHSKRNMLAVTVDAAINDGNSGGPVFHRGKVVGIAFQSMDDAENIGEMVPSPVLKTFLEGARRGKSSDVPGIGIVAQHLENPSLRESLGLRKNEGGVLVNSVQFGTSAWGVLREGDVLLELDGMKIAANGTVRYRSRFRCQFDVVVGEHHVGDPLEARILRDGRRRTVKMKMTPMAWLVPRQRYDRRPTWFVFGGLVFTRLTLQFLQIWGDKWWERAPAHLMYAYYQGNRTEECQEVVVIAQVLADEINVGYDDFEYEILAEIDGRRPRHIRDVASRVDAAEETLTLRTALGRVLHFDVAEARAATDRVAERYRVPGDRSDDLI